MALPRLFVSPLASGEITLDQDQTAHAAARRLRAGDTVVLFDGRGNEATGRVANVARGRFTIIAGSPHVRPTDARVDLTLAVSIPKGHRPDAVIEKCTELGVAAIWPMITQHAAVRPRAERAERWQRIALEAAKQSQRAWVPDIHPPASFERVVDRVHDFDASFILEPAASSHLLNLMNTLRPACCVLALIGPEGGFSLDERRAAVDAGIQPAGLGQTILRIETAAIAVATLVLGWAAARWGRPALEDAGP